MTSTLQQSATIAVALALSAAAIVVLLCFVIASLRRRALLAERRFAVLAHIAPALTSAATESTSACCVRIIDRASELVDAQSFLCFYENGLQLVLGAKSPGGYAEFLREGEACHGATIVDWVRREGNPAIVGPRPAGLDRRLGVYDLASRSVIAGPLAGSRNTVWGFAAPLLRPAAARERASVIGVLYADRPRSQPFTGDEIAMLLTVAQLGSDALARALFADRVRREMVRDSLTGLLTPAAFRKRLRDEVDARRNDASAQTSRDVALFFIDTDRFKEWNDTHGHPSGDELLRRLAAMFAQTAERAHGFAGRNGGDEFCIALLDRTKDASVELARALCRCVAEADFRELVGRDDVPGVHITISIGVAHFPKDIAADERHPTEALLEAADQQMYEAKRAGRNQVSFARARLHV